jgi:hypothetical protein
MKGSCKLLLLIIIPISLLGQTRESENKFFDKFQISVKAGLLYKNYFGSKVISQNAYYSDNVYYKYNGFSKVPTVGFQAGIEIKYKFLKYLTLSSGAIFVQRKECYEGNYETVLLNGSPLSIHKIIKYNYSNYSLEIPVMVGLTIKHLSFSFGVNFPALIYSVARYTYIPDSASLLTGKTIDNYLKPTHVYPVFQASYDFPIGRFLLSPNFEFELGEMKSVYLQVGAIVSLPL